MSKPRLSIDCVDLKLRIQARIERRARATSLDDVRARNEDNLDTSKSSFARWWRGLPMGTVEAEIERDRKRMPPVAPAAGARRRRTAPVNAKHKTWRRKKKAFDCVEMKHELQRKLAEKYKGMTWDQRIEAMQQGLETSNDPLAKWWRRLPGASASGAREK